MNPRRGQHTPHKINGDPADLAGFPRLVTEFAEWMGVHGYSPRTIENRRAMLSFLVDWLAERGVSRPVEVTRPMLESYQRACFHYRKRDGHPLSFRSQSQRLLAVRAFFKWATRAHHLLHNPASEIDLPKVEQRLPRPALSQAEAELVLAQPELTDPAGLRDRAMLEVLYATGIRRSELAHLAVFDVDDDRQTLLVRQGKGRRDRMVPLGERALLWIRRYLAEARPKLVAEPDDGTLFVSADGSGSAPTGSPRSPGSTSSPPASRSRAPATCSGTPWRPSCSKAGPTSATSKPCSATPSCPRPRSTPRSRSEPSKPSTPRPTPEPATPGTGRSPRSSPQIPSRTTTPTARPRTVTS